ncbi:energy transducer TonB [Marinifilum caeruleilacunae]|uniref:Energy transducer TonB n=1 Tax=Marinifilum caeruleilacunae TaxID=2499076 RepID=A0ABX1WZ80_9BACT|nr:energy transducer TonB [Marinifilum caeruleilacunae]NOU61424.1 energy transducer TonB [Marinifilum caeruleilacunae]
MKEKKNPQYNLEKKRIMFLQFGLIFSFMLVLTAFEYKVPFEEPKDVVLDVLDDVDMLIPITYREPEKPIEPPQVKKITLLNPTIVEDIDADPDYEPIDSFGDIEDDVQLPVENDIEEEEETPFVHAEFMPVFRPDRNKDFKAGNMDLFRTLQTSVKYPVTAQETGIQGKVYVRFVVTKTGDISDIQITRSVDPLLDNEVIRVLKNLPKFKPGMQRLKPVSVYYSAYVNFKLQ